MSRFLARASARAVALSVAALTTIGVAGAQAALPVTYSFPTALATAIAHPGQNPPGANNWACHPSAAHPYPVVLVHGTVEDDTSNWNALSPLLANHGFCVFALNYGGSNPTGNPFQGTGEIGASAGQLATFVSQVRAATGAAKVDIVGHSQGGMMPRYYLRFLGGAAVTDRLVALSPSNHGTSLDGLATLATDIGLNPLVYAVSPAFGEQEAGSSFLTHLNAVGDTVAGVGYTVIETKYDEVVTPYTSAFLTGPGVTNITLQGQCVLDLSEHLATPYDHIALQDVLNALDPAHAHAAPCSPVVPLVGG